RNRPTTVALGPQQWHGWRPGTQVLPSPHPPHPGPTSAPISGGFRAPRRPAPHEEQPPPAGSRAGTAGAPPSGPAGAGAGSSGGTLSSWAVAGPTQTARVRVAEARRRTTASLGRGVAGTLLLLLNRITPREREAYDGISPSCQSELDLPFSLKALA